MIKVSILLSTYNGEKFLREQLDSIIEQKGIEWNVLIRDDGSNDGTVLILDEYSKRDKRFSYYVGENVGPAQSFMRLIENSPDANFYAFCDQDDVWDSDKLKVAVEILEKEDECKPALYYSNLRIVDEKLNFYRLSHPVPYVQKNKYSALIENMATGCTMVFNKKALEYAKGALPSYCSMHDVWIYIICQMFGTVRYDFNAHMDYRQHGSNVVGTDLERISINVYFRKLKKMFDKNIQPRYNNAKSFYLAFEGKMMQADKDKVLKIVQYKDSFKNKIELLVDKDLCIESKLRDLIYRVLILLEII